jgi:hypothetical protein
MYRAMSALPPNADIRCDKRDVRYVLACSNPKIKVGRVVYGCSNLTWAPPYNMIGTKQC